MTWRKFALALLLATMPSTAQAQSTNAARTGGLFSASEPALSGPTLSGANIDGVVGIATIRSRWVVIDFAKLAGARAVVAESGLGLEPAGAPATLTLNLFDDVALSAVVERTARTASGSGYVLSGRIEDVEWGTWKLLVYDEAVSGTVRTPGGRYNIRTVDGVHAVSQIDTSGLPRFEDRAVAPPAGMRPGRRPSEPDSPWSAVSTADPLPWPRRSTSSSTPSDWPVVDVGVAFTYAAQEGADGLHGDAGIHGLIDEMFDNANEAYSRSGAMLRIRKAWTGLVPCEGDECKDMGAALKNLSSKMGLGRHFQGNFTGLAGADLVSWVVDIPSTTLGVGYVGAPYSVVQYNAERDHYVFAHELGHNMYLQHDRWTILNVLDSDGNRSGILNEPYPYSHGFISTSCNWRTIMAYEHKCVDEGLPGLPLKNFSNPNKLHDDGERTGVSGDAPSQEVDGPADAVRSINRKRWEVADFWRPLSDVDVLWALWRGGSNFDKTSWRWFHNCPRQSPTIFCPLHLWDGVTADAEGRVTGLYWPPKEDARAPHGPLGELPSFIAHLTELRSFSTHLGGRIHLGHKFTGRIPAAFGNLSKLETLILANSTRLYGEIPSALGNLTNLERLELQSGFRRAGNQLTGEIPATLGNLTKLRILNVSFNNLTGEIPASFGNLTSLEDLRLHGNRLTAIPTALGNMESLRSMYLSANELTGEIPASIGNLTKLRYLYLDDNELTGEIPASIGNLTDLFYLHLNENELTGQIPASIGNLSSLGILSLDNNQLSGEIHANLANLRNLGTLSIDNHTGLCLAPDFPLDSQFATLALNQGVPVCSTASVDLVVESPAVSDNTLTPGQSFRFSSTVRNQGNGASAVTTLRYYQSAEAAISTSDTIVGSATTVDGLPAGGTQAVQVGLTAPSTAGTYYYGACVEAATGESDTTNNCSAGVAVTVADEEEPGSRGTRDPDKDFDTLRAAGNNEPHGIWSDGTTMWVSDWGDAKLYAYSMGTGNRDPGGDFDTLRAAGNDSPRGIWSDGATMWVADFEDSKVYAYSMATRGHEPDRDFNTVRAAGNHYSTGIWSDGVTMWVADFVESKLYSHSVATRSHEPDKDFDTLVVAGNHRPEDLWSDGVTMWVTDNATSKVYAYSMATRSRDPGGDFDTLVAAGNHRPRGLWSDGATMWIADVDEDKLYAYHLGTPGVVGLTLDQYERYRETWGTTAGAASSSSAGPAPESAASRTIAFSDHPVRAGTPLKAVHFRELRTRIAALRAREGLPAVQWTDPALTAGVTPVRRVHLTELRAAADAVYDARGRPRPKYTDAAVTAGVTAIRAAHLMELRAAVAALE